MSPLSRIQRLRARRFGRTALASVAFAAVASIVGLLGGFSSFAAGEPASLIVRFDAGTTAEQQAAAIAAVGGTVTSTIPVLRMSVIEVPADDEYAALGALRADDVVTSADPDRPREAQAAPNDPGYDVQWALDRIGWNDVYGTLDLAGTSRLAVLDTGVDGTDPDLAGRIVPGWSAFAGTIPVEDPNGHGTALASIAASITNNGAGIAGVAYGGVEIMPVRVLDGAGVGQDADIIEGLVWSVQHGADVALMGFSSTGYSSALQAAVEYAWSNGVVVVAAVGNDGDDIAHFPAAMAKVVGVSATDRQDARWTGSNFGTSVFMAAPGTGIESVLGPVTGTSPAAAIVAGAAALLQAVDPTADPGVIVGRLARNADPVGSTDDVGNGILDLAAAVADGGTDRVVPLAGAPFGDGGPYVTYQAAATWKLVSCSDAGSATAATTFSTAEGADGVTKTIQCRIGYNGSGGQGTKVNYSVTAGATNPATVADASVTSCPAAGLTWTSTTPDVLQASGEAAPASFIDIPVKICGDSAPELDETFTFLITGGTANPTSITVTIQNDDGVAFTISPPASAAAEGDSGSTSLTFTVTKVGAGSGTVVASTSDGTAVGQSAACPAAGTVPPNPSGDYQTTTSSPALSFATADTTKTFSVPVCGDTIYEDIETFTVSLSSPSAGNSLGSPNSATGTISASDSAPVVSIAASSGGYIGALAGDDITATATSITVVQPTGGITLPSVPFTILVDSEQMSVTAVSGSVPTLTFTVTRGVNVTGSAATHKIGAPVRRTSGYLTSALNSTTATQMSVTEPLAAAARPGAAPFTIMVEDEQIYVEAKTCPETPTAAGYLCTYSLVRRGVNPPTPVSTAATHSSGVAIRKVSVPEGNTTDTDVQFYVGLIGRTEVAASFTVALSGTAVSGDYTSSPATNSLFSWSASRTAVKDVQLLTVTIKGETSREDDETVILDAVVPTSGVSLVGAKSATLVVQNDDSGVTFSAACQTSGCETQTEGTAFLTQLGTLSSSQTSSATTMVLALSVGAVLPPSGASFYVQVSGRSEIQLVTSWTGTGPYTLSVTRAQLGTSAPSGGGATSDIGTAVYMGGGTASGASYALKISASGNIGGSVKYETRLDPRLVADLPAGTALAAVGAVGGTCTPGIDVLYSGVTAGDGITLGVNGFTNFSVTICQDAVFERPETFAIAVFGAKNDAAPGADISPSGINVSYLYLTISNDELLPSIVVSDATRKVEGNAGTTTDLSFTVTRWGASEVPINGSYTVAGAALDAATPAATANDLVGATFPTGVAIGVIPASTSLSQTPVDGNGAALPITVSVQGDDEEEYPEGLQVTLILVAPAEGATARLPDDVGASAILNDDTIVRFDASRSAGAAERDLKYRFQVTVKKRDGVATSKGVLLSYVVTSGRTGASCSTTIDAPAQGAAAAAATITNNQYVDVTLCDNALPEADRTVTVTFTVTNGVIEGAANVETTTSAQSFTLYDDDKTITVKVVRDLNANGVEDGKDEPLAQAQVALYTGINASGPFGLVPVEGGPFTVKPSGTDKGTYEFKNLKNQTYYVVETDLTDYNDWTSTAALAGSGGFTSIPMQTGDPSTPYYVTAPYLNNVLKVTFDPTSAAVSGSLTAPGYPNKFLDSRKGAVITGSLYLDTNANGVAERSEVTPLSTTGESIRLYRDTGNNTFELTDTLIGSTDADETGIWGFTKLYGGTYFVVETDQTDTASTVVAPAQTAPLLGAGVDANLYKFNVIRVLLASGTDTSSGSTFYDTYVTGVIEGQVVNDLDADGTWGGLVAEGARAGVTVNVYRDVNANSTYDVATDTLSKSAPTGADGGFRFDKLMPGRYFVIETDGTGWGSTAVVAGTGTDTTATTTGAWITGVYVRNAIAVTIDVNRPSGATNSGNTFLDAEAGASIAVEVYQDRNWNGVVDSSLGDDGVTTYADDQLPLSTLTLYRDVPNVAGSNGWDAGDPVVQTATRIATGSHTFSGLTRGLYFVFETNPVGYASTGAIAPTDQGGAVLTSDRVSVLILSATVDTNLSDGDFSLRSGFRFLDTSAASTISGLVYEDLDGNGAYTAATLSSPADRLLRGAVVSLVRDNPTTGTVGELDAGDGPVVNQTTSITGAFSFTGLYAAATYWVVEQNPYGYSSTGAEPSGVTLASDLVNATAALAAYASPDSPSTVGPCVSNECIRIRIPLNATTTGTAAKNLFFDRSDYTISGTVFNDANADGALATTEPGRSLVTVDLYKVEAGVRTSQVASMQTSATTLGWFGFDRESLTEGTPALSGTYDVVVTPPTSWKGSTKTITGNGDPAKMELSSPTELRITIDGGNPSATSQELLVTRADYTIEGSILDDAAADRASAGDLPLTSPPVASPGVRLTLTRVPNPLGEVAIPLDVTTGTFAFTGLSAGTYRVVVTPPTGYKETNAIPGSLLAPPSGGTNGTTVTVTWVSNVELSITIVADGRFKAQVTNNRFLLSAADRSVSGQVFDDLNADGLLSLGVEAGLAGGKVALYWDNPSAGTTGTKDGNDILMGAADGTNSGIFPNGAWSGLVSGTYFLVRDPALQPANYLSTGVSPGTFGQKVGSDLDLIKIVLTGTSKVSTDNHFFAASATASVAGKVWDDADGSGSIPDANVEFGKGSVTVTITRNVAASGGGPALERSAPSSATAATLGDYLFDLAGGKGLLPGAYDVTVKSADVPVGWVLSPAVDPVPSLWVRRVTVTSGGAVPASSATDLYLRWKNGAITGTVFDDVDGTASATVKTYLPGVIVRLFQDVAGGTAYKYDAGIDTLVDWTTTDSKGLYRFSSLYASPSYRLSIFRPTGYVELSTGTSTHINVLGATATYGINLGSGNGGAVTLTNQHFFTQPESTISGQIVDDANADGVRASGSQGIPFAKLLVKGGPLPSAGTEVTADADGTFSIKGLNSKTSAAIAYTVTQEGYVPTGYDFTGVVKGTGTTSADPATKKITVSFTNSGTTSANNYFLDTKNDQITITGLVYDDKNADGLTTTPTLLAGAVLAVYMETGTTAGYSSDDRRMWAITSSGSREQSWTTLAAGTFSFSGLPLEASGTSTFYVVETDPTSPLRYSSTALDLVSASSSTDGVTPGSAAGSKEAGAYVVANSATLANNVLKVVVTAAKTTYKDAVFLDARDDQNTISGAVFEDKNADGANQDSTPLDSATVRLLLDDGDGNYETNGQDIPFFTLAADGITRRASVTTTPGSSTFSFGRLPNATFFVVEDDPSGYESTKAIGTAVNGVVPTQVSTTVLKFVITGSNRTSANNVFLDTKNDNVRFSGTIEDDRNGNGGALDSADTGFVNATIAVFLDDGDGTYEPGGGATGDTQMYAITDAVTGARTPTGTITLAEGSPNWYLGGLPVGKFWVRLVIPSTSHTEEAWTSPNATTVSSSTSGGSTTKVLWFTSAGSDLPANTGPLTTRWQLTLGGNSIAGYSYFDINGNGNGDFTKTGKNTKSDSPLSGTLVYLHRDGDGDFSYDPSNDPVAKPYVTTGADGAYSFTGLVPGTYFVVQDPPPSAGAPEGSSDIDFVPTGVDLPAACTTAITSGWAAGQTVCSEAPNTYPKEVVTPNNDKYVRVVVPGTAPQIALTNVYLLAQGGDVSIAISDGVSTVVAGGDLTYTVTVANVGGGVVPANSSTATVVLPTGVEFESAPSQCSLSGSTVTCRNDVSIGRGASKSYALKVHVLSDFPLDQTELIMKATVAAPAFDFNVTNNETDTGFYNLVQVGTLAADITSRNATTADVLETSAPGAATFTVLVDAEQLSVSARTLLSGSTYRYTVARGQNSTTSATHVTGAPVLKVVPLDPDVNTVTRTAPLTVTTAIYGGAGIWDGHPGETPAGSVIAGTRLVYQVTVANAGPSAADTEVVTALRASGSGYSAGKYCVGTAAECGLTGAAATKTWTDISGSGASAGVILSEAVTGQTKNAGGNWVDGGVSAQKTVFVRMDVSPSALSAPTPTTKITSGETLTSGTTGATVVAPNSVAAEALITDRADLGGSLSSALTVAAGEELLYTFVASNGGPSDARNVKVFEGLDDDFSGAKYCIGVSCSSSGAVTVPTDGTGIDLGTIGESSSKTVRIWAKVPAAAPKGTSLSSQMLGYSTTTLDWSSDTATNSTFSAISPSPIALGGTGDNIPDNNIGQTNPNATVRLEANLGVSVSGMPAVGDRIYGEEFTYTLTVTNTGPSNAPNVKVDNSVVGLEEISIDVDGRVASCETMATFPCDLGTVVALAPGNSVTLHVTSVAVPTVSLTEDVAPQLDNDASVVSSDADLTRLDQSEDVVSANDEAPVDATILKRPTQVDIAAMAEETHYYDETVSVSASLVDVLGSATYQESLDDEQHDVKFRQVCGSGATFVAGSTVTAQTNPAADGLATAAVKLDARAGNDCRIEVWFPGQAGKIHRAMLNPKTAGIAVGKRPLSLTFTAEQFIKMSSATASTSVALTGELAPMPGSGQAGDQPPLVSFLVTLYDANGFQVGNSTRYAATVVRKSDKSGWTVSANPVTGNASGQTFQIEMQLKDDKGVDDTRYQVANGGGAETAYVTLYYPTSETYAAGGGWFQDPNPDALDAKFSVTRNEKVNWGFNVKYRKGSTTPQGSFVMLIKADNGRTYKIRSTNWSNGLLTFPTKTQATFKGGAVVQVTDTLTGATILNDPYSGAQVTFRVDVASTLTGGKMISVWVSSQTNKVLWYFYRAGGGTVDTRTMLPLKGGGLLIKP